jgi:CheY-like chemotaxis protein
MNLGTNAVYAMSRDGGTLSLSLTRVRIDRTRLATALDVPLGEYVCLAARDTGIGMSQEIQERLFEPFFTTKGHAGTGLGLSVVHGIVRDHAGAITVESTIGCGSTFRIFLPVAKSAGMRPDEEVCRLLPGKGERILYIDDEEDLAFVAERVLTRLGYRCKVFSDPRSALKAFSANPDDFDAVITDLAMPGMSGVDLARALRAIKPGLPIGLTTGLWEDDADCASGAGIRTIILKPASVEELSRAVRELLPPTDPISAVLRI